MKTKSKSAFRTISEAAEELGVATSVLRFWETKFDQITPMKSNKRRYYRPDDMEVLSLIKSFLYDKRYTIEGVQKVLKQRGAKAFLNGEIQKDFFVSDEPDETPSLFLELSDETKQHLLSLRENLSELKENLQKFIAK